jgi:O-acetyl-ADP-ribose deacetylase (regulator of RNase III)
VGVLILLKVVFNMDERIKIIKGDIVASNCDAIVNAANERLAPGGGVCGAIFAAAGKQLENECLKIGHCVTSHAKITKSYDLASEDICWIIHGVGPVYRDGKNKEAKALKKTYQSIFKLLSHYKEIYKAQYVDFLKLNKVKEEDYDELLQEQDKYISKHPIKTIALPAISTGIYRFPLKEASLIALEEIQKALKNNDELEEVKIVCFNDETYKAYKWAYNEIDNK